MAQLGIVWAGPCCLLRMKLCSLERHDFALGCLFLITFNFNAKDVTSCIIGVFWPYFFCPSFGSAGLFPLLYILNMEQSWAGASVNLANNGGRTALHYAASKGWLKIAEILISHGAKINQKDKVLHFCCILFSLIFLSHMLYAWICINFCLTYACCGA